MGPRTSGRGRRRPGAVRVPRPRRPSRASGLRPGVGAPGRPRRPALRPAGPAPASPPAPALGRGLSGSRPTGRAGTSRCRAGKRYFSRWTSPLCAIRARRPPVPGRSVRTPTTRVLCGNRRRRNRVPQGSKREGRGPGLLPDAGTAPTVPLPAGRARAADARGDRGAPGWERRACSTSGACAVIGKRGGGRKPSGPTRRKERPCRRGSQVCHHRSAV